MDNWGVLEVVITIVAFLSCVLGLIIPVVKVIQKNTDAINSLTQEMRELVIDNKKDHDNFYRDINKLKQDNAILQSQHNSDVALLREQMRRD